MEANRLLFPVVHPQGVNPDDDQEDQHRTLCGHPKAQGSFKPQEVEVACKERHAKCHAKPDAQQRQSQSVDAL